MSAVAPMPARVLKRRRVIICSSSIVLQASRHAGARQAGAPYLLFSRGGTGACGPARASLPRLQHVGDPVPHEVHADGDVVDLAMVEAALLAGEHLEGLLLRADRLETLLGRGERDLLVAFAMHEEERALHFLHD